MSDVAPSTPKMWAHFKPARPAKIITILVAFFTVALAQGNPNLKKRGLAYISTDASSKDIGLFTAQNSPLSWYYNWGARPANLDALEYVPMIHSPARPDDDIAAIRRLLGQNGGKRPTSVLVFNEPDGDTEGGGTDTSPEHVASVWLDKVAPLRTENPTVNFSLPATTGSPRGLEWLRRFNSSCFSRNPQRGCEFDFVAAHWYGDFAAMAGWLGQLHELWPDKPMWVTEFALPSPAEEPAVIGMLNQSLVFLDNTTWIQRYSWFGAFRTSGANTWTGERVSLLDDSGGLTDLGVAYMGGNATGFKKGDKAPGNNENEGLALRPMGGLVLLATLVCILMQ